MPAGTLLICAMKPTTGVDPSRPPVLGPDRRIAAITTWTCWLANASMDEGRQHFDSAGGDGRRYACSAAAPRRKTAPRTAPAQRSRLHCPAARGRRGAHPSRATRRRVRSSWRSEAIIEPALSGVAAVEGHVRIEDAADPSCFLRAQRLWQNTTMRCLARFAAG